MPRRPGYRTTEVGGLATELQFAPRETLLRIADRAEALVAEVEASVRYPTDFIVFRLTGYRPDGSGRAINGEDLLADLPTLILQLSERAQLCVHETPRTGRSLPSMAESMGVSLRSLQRYRRYGLVCHMVRDAPEAPPRLVCFEDALAAFEKRSGERITRAASFSRLDDDDEERICAAAQRLAEGGASLFEAARRIAADIGRAPETVRRVLLLLDRRTGLFGAHGPLSDRDSAIIDRARRAGVPLSRLAERYGKARATIRRAARRARAQWLAAQTIPWTALPTFERIDAPRIILGARPVTNQLDVLMPRHDALEFLSACDAALAPPDNDIAAMLAALQLLQRDVAIGRRTLEAWPAARDVDELETRLRWAAQLRRRLITLLAPVVMKRLRTGGGLLPEALPKDELRALIRRSVQLLVREIDRVDALRAVRFVRRVTFVADLHAAHESALWRDRAGRALVRHRDGRVPMDDPLADVLPWGMRLDLPPRFAARLDTLEGDDAQLVRDSYGLGARPAMTVLAIAEREGSTESRITRRLEQTIDQLRVPEPG